MGAAGESPRPGMAFFEGNGLRRLYGGRLRDDPVWLDAVVSVVRRALAIPARIGAGPSRFCALAGASRARSRRAEVMSGEQALAGEPVGLLRSCDETAQLVAPLEQLGLLTLGA